MKTAIRKISSLTFLLLGFAPLLFTLVITIKKHEIRVRMEEEMETRELQSISVPVNDVVWMDKHEIWVNNQMFDIHTRELIEGVYHFTGLYDAEETELVEHEKKQGDRKQSQHQILVKLFKCIPAYYDPGNELFEQTSPLNENNLVRLIAPLKPFRDILTPPPRMVSPYTG